jgi:nitric oxide reductase activation protein
MVKRKVKSSFKNTLAMFRARLNQTVLLMATQQVMAERGYAPTPLFATLLANVSSLHSLGNALQRSGFEVINLRLPVTVRWGSSAPIDLITASMLETAMAKVRTLELSPEHFVPKEQVNALLEQKALNEQTAVERGNDANDGEDQCVQQEGEVHGG